jgi:uncharacterized membrane protein
MYELRNCPARALLLVFSAIWCAAIFSYAWLFQTGHLKTVFAISLFFSNICHQNPLRSFSLLGIALPVCARCTSTYLGWLAGIMIFPLLRQRTQSHHSFKSFMIFAALLLILDVGFDALGICNNTFLSRSFTGVLFGAGSSLFLLYSIEELR